MDQEEIKMALLFIHFEILKNKIKPLFELYLNGKKLPVASGEFEEMIMELEFCIAELHYYGIEKCREAYLKTTAAERIAARN
jgi:hypothetical protein